MIAILLASVLLQSAAAVLALRLIRVTGWRLPWVLLAAALALMAGRRGIALAGALGGRSPPALGTELLVLGTSVLLFAAVIVLPTLFMRLRNAHLLVEDAERRSRLVLEHVVEVVARVDEAGVIRYASPSAAVVLGRDPATLVGTRLVELAVPEDAGRLLAFVGRRSAQPGPPPTIVLQVRRPDGEVRSVEAAANDRLDDPAVRAVVLTMRDVTEREVGRVAIAQGEERYRLVVSHASDGIVVTDPDGHCVDANPAACALLGRPREDLLGRHIGELIAPEDLAARPLVLDHLRTSGEIVTERTLMRRDGTRAAVEVAAKVLPDGRFLALIRDLAERARATAAIRASERRFRRLVEQGWDVILLVNGDGGITYISPTVERVLGYTPEEVVGRRFFEFIHPNDLERVGREFAAVRTVPGRTVTAEVHVRHRDGTWRWVEANGINLLADPDVGAIVGTCRDVTERRALERQLRQSQKMEAVGQLTGGIAHDFNNILTTVLANTDLLATGLGDRPDLLGDLGDIRAAAARGADLIRKLLAFSRREPIAVEPLALHAVVADAQAIIRRLLPENIEIRVQADPSAASVLADRAAVLQMIMNLVTNARDAMPDGGTLRLRTFDATVDAAQCAHWGFGRPGRYVCLEVRDSGVGMDEATRTKIFEPFFTTKPVGKGTGLGLSMVYGLVKRHGGYIDVQAARGAGATFSIYLPAALAAAAVDGGTSPAQTPGAVRGGRETILLVEDEEAIRRSARRVLERFGYRVLTASDGAEALEVLAAQGRAIDLVLTDVVMPRMGGARLYRAARGRPYVPRFLFTSGYTERELPSEESLDPAVPFLPKPWLATELVTRVREVLDAPAPVWST